MKRITPTNRGTDAPVGQAEATAFANKLKGTMDTIDMNVMNAAAIDVAIAGQRVPFIHTVTITLNGATGGASITIQGFTSDLLDEDVTIERQVPR